jgi:hypothetical protein
MNEAWQAAALTAATLLAWLRLLALDGHLARAEPKTVRYHILHAAARADPRRPPASPEDPGQLALGRRHRDRLGPDHRPSARPLTSTTPSLRSRKEHLGPWTPATRPASRVRSSVDAPEPRGMRPELRPARPVPNGFQECPWFTARRRCYLRCRYSGMVCQQDHPAYIPRILRPVRALTSVSTSREASDW